ncbi:MAG: serine/threonine protein kinase [Myxococcales bacterium]|nr:serine/threonine protein kinase [Myxococcales bacterium]
MSLAIVADTEPVLGRYLLGTRVGAGAFGSVYNAIDTRSGQTVVVKLFDGQEDGFGSWTSEMRLVLRFRHEHIVSCLDIGFDHVHRLWALVFVKAEGGSLRRALASKRRFSPRQSAELLCDIASALAYAHAQGVIHRDVKPENILAQHAAEDSRWLLTDFGAGRFLASGESARSPAGSLEYMAPEAFLGQAGAPSDQYSLGVLGCELWLGRLPRREELPAVQASLRGQGPLAEILARLCETDPVARFSSMDEVVRTLQQVLIEMKDSGDILEYVRAYLRVQRGLPEPEIDRLIQDWGERGSILDFLVEKKLLSRTVARTAEAIRKGYLDASLESIFGDPKPKKESAADIVPLREQKKEDLAAPQKTEDVLAASDGIAAAPPPAAPVLPPAAPVLLPAAPVLPPAAALAPTMTPAVTAPAVVSRRDAPSRSDAVAAARSDAAPRPTPLRPAPGVRVGRYVLQEALGEGATATVFRSFHELLSMPVAIKIFEPLDANSDPEGTTRFRREAQTLVRLEHPNIVRIVDVDVWEGMPFIVMEYVGETTLATQIQNLGRLPAPRIAQIGLAVAEALEAASRQGLLHRDVKPSNILERKDGHIKLVDFGIAVRRTTSGLLSDPQAALGLVSGTPAYIAPEQALRPSQIDFRADMYSLGATLYHAATGRPLFNRGTPHDLLMAHINETPIHINDLDPSFDRHLAYAIHHMLAKQPEHRFASWHEVREALSYSLYRQDEPELLITQTSTGMDLTTTPEPESKTSRGEASSAGTSSPKASSVSLNTQEKEARQSASEEKGMSSDGAAEPERATHSGAVRATALSADSLRVSGNPVALSRPSSRSLEIPRTPDLSVAESPKAERAVSETQGSPLARLRQLGLRLRESWKASPRSEQRLAIAAVSLLLLTMFFLFLFSERGG